MLPLPPPQDQRPVTDVMLAAVEGYAQRIESRPAVLVGSTSDEALGLSAHERCARLAVWLN